MGKKLWYYAENYGTIPKTKIFASQQQKDYDSFLEYQRQCINWILDKVVGLTMNVAKCKTLQ